MTLHRRPKHLGEVVLSINMPGETICVDFFRRPDGTFGFEEYRRDVETQEGWFPIGFHSGNLYDTLNHDKAAALKAVAWLESEM